MFCFGTLHIPGPNRSKLASLPSAHPSWRPSSQPWQPSVLGTGSSQRICETPAPGLWSQGTPKYGESPVRERAARERTSPLAHARPGSHRHCGESSFRAGSQEPVCQGGDGTVASRGRAPQFDPSLMRRCLPGHPGPLAIPRAPAPTTPGAACPQFPRARLAQGAGTYPAPPGAARGRVAATEKGRPPLAARFSCAAAVHGRENSQIKDVRTRGCARVRALRRPRLQCPTARRTRH